MFENLLLGLTTALSIHNLSYAFIGVLLGNFIGVLPGIGAMAAIAMLLPATYGLDPTGALMMLAGLYYGASFGGATTSILLNLPGTAAHAVVCLDGNPLARQGRGGQAIFMAMFASFIGVAVGIVLMTFFSPVLADLALSFGPAEYFSLMLMGLLAASAITLGSPINGVVSMIFGLVLGVVGSDVNSGVERFTLGMSNLADGVSLVAVAMGLFGVNEVLKNVGSLGEGTLLARNVSASTVRPSRKQLKESAGPIARGATIGSILGILPGTGGALAAFISYAVEKKISKEPKKFGKGMMAGVSGPESANSSGAITAFIPTLTLGIPGSAVMALILAAMLIHDVTPGPQIISDHPSLFWGLIMSFWIGNLMLMLLNIPLIGIWVKMLSIPYRWIFPVVMFLIAIGVFSVSNSLFDVGQVLVIGIVGVLLALLGFEPAPLVLGLVLGPMMEENFRRALLLSRGDALTFFTRPLSGAFMAVTVLILAAGLWGRYRRKKATRATAA